MSRPAPAPPYPGQIVGAPAAAPTSRRVMACVVDVAIGAALALAVGTLVAVAVFAPGPAQTAAGLAGGILLVQLAVGAVAVAWTIVLSVLQGGAGSMGQHAAGVRVVDRDTATPIGFGRAFMRTIVWSATGSIIVGWFSPLFDASRHRQGWHDKVARAVVVPAAKRPHADAAPPPAWIAAAPPRPAIDEGIDPAEVAAAARPRVGAAGSRPVEPEPAEEELPTPPAEVISAVPGMIDPAPALGVAAVPGFAPASAPAPAASLPPIPRAAPDASDPNDPVLGATVARNPIPTGAALLVWDNGSRTGVRGRTLFGRNPAREDGASVVAVRDETLSLSKTHFEIDVEGDDIRVMDRHSTNGVVLVRNGRRAPLSPGQLTPVRTGDRLEFGDRSATVERAE